MIRLTTQCTLALVLLALLVEPVLPAPPEGADGRLAPFYQSLRMPNGSHASCCSFADCRPVVSDLTSHGYRIYYQGRWMDVPPDTVIRDKVNEAGEPVACITIIAGEETILCFVPGAAT